ncbi:related to N-acetylglucosaminyl-phosphatidylinositol de-N-acetylase [Ustilago bromivora]|uniref:N-acetylglucosaminylphosphatidylinositol deacetylase n=1 Tax=Ustilago bromivora TaxID=307758 RepID=A0A1K0H6S9_9BASI|nr:related to N-acetylglucosaminyl-phosphatidylinositol de-N-acetylase [Ustilago bromivora]SYW85353.1 related to N-acetylglucosaminyl-phosphatidylinositol de-N-acetylase [Ustilago bromivora]
MADQPLNPLQMARMAIPRPSFFLVVFLGSIIVQFMISGVRIQTTDTFDDSARTLPSSVLLVTAHPDDEAMFFAPSIQALAAAGTTIYALCLSTGNAAGLGTERTRELFNSYNVLGVPAGKVKYVDHPLLQDSMEAVWPNDHIASLVNKHINTLPSIEALITFDKRGVSGHTNHVATYNGTRNFALSRELPLYVLPSLEVWEKFNSVPFAVWETITYSGRPPASKAAISEEKGYAPASEIHALASPAQYANVVKAMWKHQTQLVWFRYLYLLFSRYMFSNRLVLWTPELDLVDS